MTKQELEKKIREADRAYYTNGTSDISDEVYDALKKELREIDPKNELLKSLGEDHTDGFNKVTRKYPMLSLEKMQANPENDKDFSELEKWANGVLKEFAQSTFYVQPKVDGMSVELHYENGMLVSASTRGTGWEGDDITSNLVKGKVVPETLNTNIPDLYLRGELYISKEEFKRINDSIEGKKFANARNLCAGTVKALEYIPDRKIQFVLHGMWGNSQIALLPVASRVALIQSLVPNTETSIVAVPTCTADTVADLGNLVKAVYDGQDGYDFDIDGAVIKIDEGFVRTAMGNTDHHPRWAKAWKFAPKPGRTKVEGIAYQIGGKTGKIVPVALLEPVQLCGTLVSKASLANVGLMAAMGIKPGATVEIVKANEIIPHVTAVLDEDAAPYQLPPQMTCPSCGSVAKLVYGKSYGKGGAATHTADYVCENIHCSGRAKAALRTAIGSSGLNILGIGPEICDAFIEKYPLLDAIELVSLPKENYPDCLSPLQKDNLHKEVRAARNAPLWRWISALQIPGIAEGTARKISECCKTFSEFCGKVITDDVTFTCLPASKKQCCKDILLEVPSPYDRMMAMALNPVSDNYVDASEEKPLSGLSFVVTGSFDTGRRALETKIPQLGGALKSSISKKVDYLVAGYDVGATKTNKAKELGIPIISEKEFLAMVEEKLKAQTENEEV